MDASLDMSIARADASLRREQRQDGHYLYELEADATIPAEYVLLEHYLDRIEPELEQKIGVYLRRIQGDHATNPGGWPLFHGGKFDLSASVKAYFALKAIGDSPDAPHMVRARELILKAGGAERSNVFTRIQLALFGAVPWDACPVMPVELVLMPSWFPITTRKISYWSRTVLTPLLVLMAKRPVARNPRNVRIDELFRTPPAQIRDWIRGPYKSAWGHVFKAVDSALRPLERHFPAKSRARALAKARDFIVERLNGEDGLGAIYPAMANAAMMFDMLGDRHNFDIAYGSVKKLLVVHGDEAYCQPCLSPIWDTSLAAHALAEAGSDAPVAAACDWLIPRQILDVVGDWADNTPGTRPGGWAFQYNNAHYPDVDDTAVVGMIMHRAKDPAYAQAISRAREWIVGMQSTNGAWGAFDINNDRQYLNHIPFADHGALLDPPTEDVTARCVSFLAQLGHQEDRPAIARGVAYLRATQKPDGSWFGRWGTNYIYGTWSVLCALNAAGVDHDDPAMTRAVAWLLAKQRADGGWGEDCESYGDAPPGEFHGEAAQSLPSQTAWAMLGLMAAGQVDHAAVQRGVAFLQNTQDGQGSWTEKAYNAVGFPRVFYLKYHGYPRFFPLLALSRYRNLMASNDRRVQFGF
ncbi:MAG TPA: squalene--hopene cyclase [Acidocella sp.]|jgi:squalene-hopene/tetraprenyl-beta-curcumene cyclase|uniref:squalene--hopene cyclase n=1 Tax=Acidocella sp. TaxID=50710 RepID=UPI002BB3E6E5|nr:squalene--hopene cyclase [Acidocella sp.]HVE21301.1 squalene--hopene cyclase [Acidocella sp.]